MATKYIFVGEESRTALKTGINTITDPIALSLGVKGKCIVLHSKLGNFISKDGYTISKAIDLVNEIEKIGAGFVKEVAKKTVDEAGDGTTSVSVLFREIVNEGFKQVTAGGSSINLKSGIDKAVMAVVDNIKSMSKKVETTSKELIQVATIAANNDLVLGEMIADVYAKIGEHGQVHVKDSKSFNTYSDVVEGYQFERGLISPHFVNRIEELTCELHNPYVLVYEGTINRWNDIGLLMKSIFEQKRSLLIIAEDFDSETVQNLIANKERGGFAVALVKSPSFGDTRKEMMEDISVITGATYISEERGYKLSEINLTHFGNCSEIHITKDQTTIIKGNGSKTAIEARVNRIMTQISQAKSIPEETMQKERLSKLKGGLAVIYVGAVSETEISEKKDRIDDAVRATKAAIEEGVVAGAGTTLIRSISVLDTIECANDEEKTGVSIIKKSLESVLRQICKNAGDDESYIVRQVKEATGNIGYNAKTGTIEDLVESGILDASKVVRVAFENAASVAATLITTDCLVVNTD